MTTVLYELLVYALLILFAGFAFDSGTVKIIGGCFSAAATIMILIDIWLYISTKVGDNINDVTNPEKVNDDE